MKQAVRQPRPRVHAQATASAFPGKYLSLTSFRRDGTGVATPVWFVEADGRLLVETDAGSYKVRRIRRDPRVTIALCTATGRLRGTPVPAWAELLPDAEVAHLDRLMARKYRIDLLVIKPIRILQAALRRGSARGTPVVLQITPGVGSA
jgi:PPOX class probable F420-dependent enzyme